MLFSLRWLRRYVDLPPDTAAVAERLTFAGFTVEGVTRLPPPIDDEVLDVDVTTNRPDCMCHLGLARELAVLLDRPLAVPGGVPAATSGGAGSHGSDAAGGAGERRPDPLEARIAVQVADPLGCPRYVARVVDGLQVAPSPEWLVAQLAAIGQRSVNNVVDVTNFVLWEMGQPIHAFDLDRLAGGRLTVRRAVAGETLTTLDGTARDLAPDILVIADVERPVALAGIMGGRNSEVSPATRSVLIESAHFDRTVVRKGAKRLGMHTDASHRFERGADLEACRAAADRVAALLVEVAGGRAVPGALDCRVPPPAPRRGRLDLARLDAFTGVRFAAADVVRWLTGLGFGLAPAPASGPPAWEVTVPSWRWFDFEPRPDGRLYEADLFEEPIRILGFDAIPAQLPALPGSDGPRTERQRARDRVRRCLAGAGFAEAINFGFEDPAVAATLPTLRPGVAPLLLANPLSERYAAMRVSLLGNLVDNARFNQRRGAAAVRLFEVASVFFARPQPAGQAPQQPDEQEHVALVCGGKVGLPWDREVALDLFDLKGVVEALAAALGVHLTARRATLPGMLAGSTAELLDTAGAVVGILGRLEATDGYPLFACEIALAALQGAPRAAVQLPPRVPGIGADLTLTHAREVSWTDLAAVIESLRPADLVDVTLKARYEGEGVPPGAVNTTIAFYYNAADRSLTQAEVNDRQQTLAAALAARFAWHADGSAPPKGPAVGDVYGEPWL